MNLKERIDFELGGVNGWLKIDTGDSYVALAKQLMQHGFSEDEAIAFLSEVLFIASAEYGDSDE